MTLIERLLDAETRPYPWGWVIGGLVIGIAALLWGCGESKRTPQQEYCDNAPITVTLYRPGVAPWFYKTYGPYATDGAWIRFKDCTGDSIVLSGMVVVTDHLPKPFSTPHRMFRNEDNPGTTGQ